MTPPIQTGDPFPQLAAQLEKRFWEFAATPTSDPRLARLSELIRTSAPISVIDAAIRELSHRGYLRGTLLVLASALRDSEPRSDIALRLAQELLDALDVPLGLELARAVLTLPECTRRRYDPDGPYVLTHLLLGETLLEQGDTSAALDHFEAVLSSDIHHVRGLQGWRKCLAVQVTHGARGMPLRRIADRIEGLEDTQLLGGEHTRYTPGRPLGRGRHAIVFSARDHELHRDVAIKKFIERGPESQRGLHAPTRFLAEAKALASVRSTHVVRIFDVEPEQRWIVMELCQGGTLRQALRRRQLDRQNLDELGRQLHLAVGAVHLAGQIHRDIKPANILLRAIGETVDAALGDFGLVRHVDHQRQRAAGTLRYLAPEVRRGQPATAASDWYSLGVVLLELALAPLPLPVEFDQLEQQAGAHSHIPTDLQEHWRERLTRLLSRTPGERLW